MLIVQEVIFEVTIANNFYPKNFYTSRANRIYKNITMCFTKSLLVEFK